MCRGDASPATGLSAARAWGGLCSLAIALASSALPAAEPAPPLTTEQQRDLDAAKVLFARAFKLHRDGRYDEGIGPSRQATDELKRLLGDKDPRYVASLNNLAELFREKGDYARAEPLHRQALEIRKATLGDKHPLYAVSLNSLAELYRQMGNYAQAEPLYHQAIAIRKEVLGDKHADYARCLNDLALLYDAMGDYVRAEPLFRQSSEIYKAALGEKHRHYANSLNNLAMLYHRMGDYARAEPLYRRSLDICKAALGENHPNYAQGLSNLALLYYLIGDYARAEPLFRQAIEIRKATLGEKHPLYALSVSNLAGMYFAMGDYGRAEPLFRQALEVREAAVGEKHPDYAESLNNLAALYDAKGDHVRAEPLYRRTLDIYKATLGDKHPNYAQCLSNLAVPELATGRAAEAEKHARQAMAIRRTSLDLASAVQSERQQLAMARGVQNYLDTYLIVALAARTAPGEVYTQLAAWKGSVLAQQQQLRARARALAADPRSELARLFVQLDQQSRTLAVRYRSVPKPEEAEQAQRATRALAESVEELQQQLARLDPDFHRSWAERSFSSDTLREALPAQTALMDLFEYSHYIPRSKPGEKPRCERRYLAFVLRSDQPVACIELGPSAPINGLVEDWRKGFGQLPAEGGKLPGDELRRIVWQPVAGTLAGAQTVLVSPDGALAQLPWAALPGETPGTFLIEERRLAVIPIPQMLPDLLRKDPPTGPPASLLLVGDIDYGSDPGTPKNLLATRAVVGRRGDGTAEFPALEAAPGELSSIRDWYDQAAERGKVRVLRHRDATEAAFRDQAPQHPWLHLITHGYFDQGRSSTARSPRPLDPGLLSGLAFAGANTPLVAGKDDGILTALEVAAIDLSKVHTVVLSACDAGLGEAAGGEGLLGLQRAFQVAGAKTVVASLWKVPDAATRRLMERYYENLWDRKLGRLAALRDAQIFMIHDRASRKSEPTRGLVLAGREPADDGPLPPHYWAAFVLSGDWR
jgi:CHAT domain-containing protein/tetratricopeptide (TPR) repeat protein